MRRWRWSTVLVALVSLFLLLLGGTAGPSPPTAASGRPDALPKPGGRLDQSTDQSWMIQVVDAGGYTSLELDAAGQPHIAHMGPYPHYGLRYDRFDGTHWVTETVDSAGHIGDWASLALDTADHPHISYMDADHGDLRYATFDGTVWITTTVDFTDTVGWFTSIALDSAGRPHIAYFDDSNGNVRYASYDGREWHLEIVDTPGIVGWYASLALDAADQPHIAYHDRTLGTLKYARREGAGWHTEVVDANSYAGWHTSIAVDAAGRPHIAYCTDYYPRALCDDLRYAYLDGPSWITTTVDSDGWTGGWASLSLDDQGVPHIAYCHYHWMPDWSHCDQLRYASLDGQAWQIEIVDALGEPGAYASLDLDAQGYPHVSYWDGLTGALRYAVKCLPPAGASVSGPGALLVGAAGRFTAAPIPPTATLPLTFSWDNGSVGPTAAYSWTLPGTYALTATLTNLCGMGTGTLSVRVLEEWPHSFYLPLIGIRP